MPNGTLAAEDYLPRLVHRPLFQILEEMHGIRASKTIALIQKPRIMVKGWLVI